VHGGRAMRDGWAGWLGLRRLSDLGDQREAYAATVNPRFSVTAEAALVFANSGCPPKRFDGVQNPSDPAQNRIVV
jgi:hypothetical protein